LVEHWCFFEVSIDFCLYIRLELRNSLYCMYIERGESQFTLECG
jgi:hypothetical protein